VVHDDRLDDLQEADQLEPVQALGAGLVAVHVGQPRIDGRVGRGSDRRCGQTGRTRGPRASSCWSKTPSARPDPGRGCTARRERVGSRPAGPARCSRTSRTSGAAGRRTAHGCARRTGPGTRPPPAARSSSTSARTGAASTCWTTLWTWNTSRGEPKRVHAVFAADTAGHSNAPTLGPLDSPRQAV
jgi:hypothetical protein